MSNPYFKEYSNESLNFLYFLLECERNRLTLRLASKVGCIGKTQIYLVFRSICTNFAPCIMI